MKATAPLPPCPGPARNLDFVNKYQWEPTWLCGKGEVRELNPDASRLWVEGEGGAEAVFSPEARRPKWLRAATSREPACLFFGEGRRI